MRTLIIAGKLFDGVTDRLTERMRILVDEGVIQAVGPSLSGSEGATVIDLSDKTVTPGLIDAHVHIDFFDWRSLFHDLVATSSEWKSMAVLHNAHKSLLGGFTTLRAFGLYGGYGLVDARNAIEKGYFPGARLVVAPHCLGSTGGHADLTGSLRGNPRLSDAVTHDCIVVGVDGFRDAVRREFKYGADWIKIIVSGGFASPHDLPDQQQLSDAELRAALATAKDLGLPSAAHVYFPPLIRKLITFGVSSIEHGSLLDEPTARLMEESGTPLIPTFVAYDDVVLGCPDDLKLRSSEYRRKLEHFRHLLTKGRETIVASDMTLGYGTDLVSAHDPTDHWREYASWIRSGIEPFRALKAVTSVNAAILRMPNLGQIAPGKTADVAAWDTDIVKDPDAFSECAFVMKEGKVFKQPRT